MVKLTFCGSGGKGGLFVTWSDDNCLGKLLHFILPHSLHTSCHHAPANFRQVRDTKSMGI